MGTENLVYVVCDDPDFTSVLEEILREPGYLVRSFRCAHITNSLLSHPVVPCLLFLTLPMRYLDDMRVLEEVRSFPGFGKVPIVLTNHHSSSLAHCLKQPCQLSEILEVAELLVPLRGGGA